MQDNVTTIDLVDKLKLDQSIAIKFPAIKFDKSGQRVMLVTDCLSDDDIDSGVLFGGENGQTISNLINAAIQDAKCQPQVVYCASTACYKVDNLSEIEIANNRRKIIKALVKQIVQFKINVVVLSGQSELNQWLPHIEFERNFTREQLKLLNGRLIPIKIEGYKCQIILSISPQYFNSLDYKDFKSKINTLGFVKQALAMAFLGKNRYTLPNPPKANTHKIINTVKKFDLFYRKLIKAKVVSIDTETTNLQRVYGNRTLVILFCLDGHVCEMLPYMHPSTPFTGNELIYITKKLRMYFEKNHAKYHIYQNAKFDIMRFYVDLGVRYYAAPVYDISSGEFSLDENRKFLDTDYLKEDGVDGVYNLEMLSAQYGALSYEDSPIKKSDRDRMEDFSLEDILTYGAIDVINPYHIAIFQQQEAKRRGPQYNQFLNSVTQIGSDMILTFVDMEKNGLLVDKKYLYYLLSPTSPLIGEIEKAKEGLQKNKNIRRANKYLLRTQGVPHKDVGIWQTNNQQMWVFDINKTKHQQLLFFDLLKMEPVSYRKDGGGRTGKEFLKEYEAIPEVKLLTEFREADKLRNTYSAGLYKVITKNPDNYTDWRVRAFFHYLGILTGRTGVGKPNTQNLPSRGRMAKIIKRLFICSRGKIMIHVDYSTNEVRQWGNISGDKKIGEAFTPGMVMRRRLRLMRLKNLALDAALFDWIAKNEWDKLKTITDMDACLDKHRKSNLIKEIQLLKEIRVNGDVHRKNYEMFFKKPAAEVTDEERTSVKTVVFGTIYDKTAKGLAKELYKKEVAAIERKYRQIMRQALLAQDAEKYNQLTEKYETELQPYWEAAQKIIDKMFGTFKKGHAWIQKTQANAEKNMYVITPFGLVRHLWGYMHYKKAAHNVMKRRGPNSSIQGSSSQIGYMGARIMSQFMWQIKKLNLGWLHTNFVHDAVIAEADISMLPLTLYYLEHSLTTQVHKRAKKVFNFKMFLSLEIDIELGGSEGKMVKWDGTLSGLINAVSIAVDFMNQELAYKLDKAKLIKNIKHNFALVSPYRIQELEKLGDSCKASTKMLLTPDIAKTLAWQH